MMAKLADGEGGRQPQMSEAGRMAGASPNAWETRLESAVDFDAAGDVCLSPLPGP